MLISRVLAGSTELLTYKVVKVSKKNGSTRLITKPSEALKRVQRRFVALLQASGITFPSATAFVHGSSPVHNVLRHEHGKYFYLLDFKNAFPHVSAKRLCEILLDLLPELGTAEEVLDFLQQYCFLESGELMQGGPASPFLFNLYCEVLVDNPLREALQMKGEKRVVYSRYADDLTFSSKQQPFVSSLRKRIHKILGEAGFEINWQKTRICTRGVDAIEITGLRLLGSGGLALGEETQKKFERALDAWLALGTRDRDAKSTKSLAGHIGQYRSVRPWLRENTVTRRLDFKVAEFDSLTYKPTRRGESRFGRSFLDSLRTRASLSDIMEPHLNPLPNRGGKKLRWSQGRRAGTRRATALCPFHDEKSPSFSIYEGQGTFHCFGCGAHGDVFDVVMKFKKIDFPGAVAYVARLLGEPLPPEPPWRREKRAP